MASEQTEKPTPKKLRDAREKGQVARSRDLAMAVASVAATFALARLGSRLVIGLQGRLAADLARVGDFAHQDITGSQVAAIAAGSAQFIAWLVGPIALATMIAGVGAQGFQGGWTFSAGALQLNWSRLSPANGIKRLNLSQSPLDVLKTLVSVSAIAYLAWITLDAVTGDSVGLTRLDAHDSALVGWAHVERLLWRTGTILGLLALGDYGLQWYRMMRSLRMSKQEIRDEAREQDGNAEVKSRVRRVQRDMARGRMIADVARATVVITNPTHYAVALEYRRDTMDAPRVVAKGRDLIAARIREAARKHEVPIVENKPLAQALFKSSEVGDTIPGHLFAAVAEVLAYLMRLKQLML